MPHTVFGMPFWTVAIIFVAIWTGLDSISKEIASLRRPVAAAQSVAIAISIVFFSIQILEWTGLI